MHAGLDDAIPSVTWNMAPSQAWACAVGCRMRSVGKLSAAVHDLSIFFAQRSRRVCCGCVLVGCRQQKAIRVSRPWASELTKVLRNLVDVFATAGMVAARVADNWL